MVLSLSTVHSFVIFCLFFLQSVACFHMGQCCPIMCSLCASNIDRACHRATVSSSQLDFSQCQPLEKSCKRCWDTSHNDSIIAIYSFCVWNSMEDDGGVCVCFSSMFVSGFLRRLRWKWVAIKQHITLKLLLTSVLPGRFWLKWSMPIPPLKLRDLKREVGPKESSCQSQKCGFSLFGSPCPSLEGQAKRKWSQTHWLKNLRQRCLVFFLVES